LICASVCRENSFKQTQKFNDHHLEKHRKPVGEFSFATMAAAFPADASVRRAANAMSSKYSGENRRLALPRGMPTMFDPSSTVPITKPLSIRGNPRRFSGLALHLR
jgi:hypothetical protein